MSALVDIAVGLMVVFLLFSIVVAGVAEWSAQFFGRRGNFLRLGLQRLRKRRSGLPSRTASSLDRIVVPRS